jgi:SpoVK/Ycf46/Vps4 family AAA+-type ATPase
MQPKLFENVVEFPDSDYAERYNRLVGLDEVKEILEKEAESHLRPDLIQEWSKKHHGCHLPVLELIERRPPLLIFAGDVGTGKTEIGTTFGDRLARKTKLPVKLFSLSLTTRGAGFVGDMTKLLTEAFREFREKCPKKTGAGNKPTGAAILLIDEADSLAQSRESNQMHHEDRVGVNALIRGIDDLAEAKLPCLVIMCTNRLDSLDPAIRRRAAMVFTFKRPSKEQRKSILQKNLAGANLSDSALDQIAGALGKRSGGNHGFTCSDLTHRFLPSLVLAAYPTEKITLDLALSVANGLEPTPPFKEQN